MQVPIYIATSDYETLGKHLPSDCKTVPQFISQLVKQNAEFYRKAVSGDGTPIVPQYARQ